jgi:hypothetical protein
MQVVTLLDCGLLFFHPNAMFLCKGVLTNPRHLPGDLPARIATSDLKAVAGDFPAMYRFSPGAPIKVSR